MNKKVCIFCGSRNGTMEEHEIRSLELATCYAQAGFDLVYGGGKYGLMGAIARCFLGEGRHVRAIYPSRFIDGEQILLDDGVEQVVVPNMFERKRIMMESADIFIALPGGIGTFDEIGDVYTQMKIGFVDKYCGILNVNRYYRPFEQMLQQMVDHDFLSEVQKNQLIFESDPQLLFHQSFRWWKRKSLIDKVAYVTLKNGQVLMTRSKGKEKYYLPGGKREVGEGDQDTLIREVQEELAVDIVPDSISYLGTFKAQADGREAGVEVQMICYQAAFEGQLHASSEIAEICWMNYHHIDSVAPVDKKIFEYLHASQLLR